MTKKVKTELRGDTWSLRGTFPSVSGGVKQQRISLRRLGLDWSSEQKAESYAQRVEQDLELLTHDEFIGEWIWTPTKKEAFQQVSGWSLMGEKPPSVPAVYLISVEEDALLECGHCAQAGEVIYVGQSYRLSERLTSAHPVLFFLKETAVKYSITYRNRNEERTRLFLEAELIARYKPILQFGGVPERYKKLRSGQQCKNQALSPQEFLQLLEQLAAGEAEMARELYATGCSLKEAIWVTGYKYGEKKFSRKLANLGYNVYQLKLGDKAKSRASSSRKSAPGQIPLMV